MWIEKQTAIAAILSDMDAEIAALEARLAEARHIKQGMMQELLTGRVRRYESLHSDVVDLLKLLTSIIKLSKSRNTL